MEPFESIASKSTSVPNNSEASTSRINLLQNGVPKPLWLEGEKILNQKFFVHCRYVSAFYANVVKKSKKKRQKDRRRFREPNDVLLTNIFYNRNFETIENGEDVESFHSSFSGSNEQLDESHSNVDSFPLPGTAATSLMNLLDHFACGLEELFPNFVLSEKLRPYVSECDTVHIMSKMQKVVSRMEIILETQVAEFVTRESDSETKICTKDLIDDIKEQLSLKISNNNNGISSTKLKKKKKIKNRNTNDKQ